MIYVFEDGTTVYNAELLSKEQKERAVAVEKLPEPNPPKGKIGRIKASKETGEVYYEYEDIPVEEEVEEEPEKAMPEAVISNRQIMEAIKDLTKLVQEKR